MAKTDYDLIVIGAGPGGYVAAIRAAQLGMKTAVVEREHLGGVCLNWGCIPTKALLKSAEALEQARRAKEFGVDIGGVATPDIAAMVARSRQVSAQLNAGVGHLLRKNKVDVIWGEARLGGGGKVSVAAPTKAAVEPSHPAPPKTKGWGLYRAKHVIIATGARPRVAPGLEPDGQVVTTYFQAMTPERTPKSLLVVGAGPIGMEFASFYASVGAEVAVVESQAEVLPQEDPEIARFVRDAFGKRGVEVLTSTRISRLDVVDGAARAKLVDAAGGTADRSFERVVSAIGVIPNTEGLGLEDVGVDVAAGGVVTTGAGLTSCPGVYAIGDVAGAPMLAHKAEHEAVLCVEAIANGGGPSLDASRVPACAYGQPQVASIGLSEAAARRTGRRIRVGRFPFAANGKAVALGETDGFVKTVFDDATGELLGAHLVGPEVTELIHAFVTAIGHETTDDHLRRLVYAHPTLSEALHEAVLNAQGAGLHK